MKVEIDVHSVNDLEHFLAGMEHRVSDFSIPLSQIADFLLQDVLDAFSTGGESLGLSWDPLSNSTIKRWGDHPFGQGPTGNLFAGIHKFVRPFVSGVESTAPHTHFFESGTHGSHSAPSAGGPIRIRHTPQMPGVDREPPREFLLITEDRTEQGIDLILDYALGEGNWEKSAA